jgi:hypothetical protein
MRIEKHELRSLMNDWDPIGLIEAGAPADEYECVVGPLLRMLEERAPVGAIAKYLASEFEEHFGVPITDAAAFGERASSWYETRWPATTAR